ncbi:hypothetical protein EW146_g4980 [Bondarzewia mesenterica]|uniref:Threonine/serine exporter-like N-terminal domain-containing protein n=1 Tax=Bondarzewia mesenterica TaxID=1095465 RepID=A0A4S4LSU2_9AGAM|nr:hypothetical protein EW146_g4980 [Bondarzewia mesenterica]
MPGVIPINRVSDLGTQYSSKSDPNHDRDIRPERPSMGRRRTSTRFPRDPSVLNYRLDNSVAPDASPFSFSQTPIIPPIAAASPFHHTSGWSVRRPFEFESTPNLGNFPTSRTLPNVSAYQDTPRRRSDESDETLYSSNNYDVYDTGRLSFPSERQSYDIPPPNTASNYAIRPRDFSYRRHRSSSFAGLEDHAGPALGEKNRPRGWSNDLSIEAGIETQPQTPCPPGGGFFINLFEHYRASHAPHHDLDRSEPSALSTSVTDLHRSESSLSNESEGLDLDDPRITGVRKNRLEDPEDIEDTCKKQIGLQGLDYRMPFLNRQRFIMKLGRALMFFGAPSHRIESQLHAACRVLDVKAEFILLPNLMISTFGDEGTKTSETHILRCGGRLALGNLVKVHQIYRRVVHDEVSAKKATDLLVELVKSPPIYSATERSVLSLLLAALICPLTFGGSFIDMLIAALAGLLLCVLQQLVASNSTLYSSIFDITVTIFISFTVRGLSSIGKEIFCYTAISSASIVTILPGYLVPGSDLYLVVDPGQRGKLEAFGSALQRTVIYNGVFTPDNSTGSEFSSLSTFTFANATTSYFSPTNIVKGCYRHPGFAWYLQPFPWWTQFLIVPLFGICTTLANLQPYRSKEFPVMIIIACVSYATNKVAVHYIFNRSEVVSAVGAFTVGMLGNVYSRKMGSTAFTSVVPGILFLVPSGLSQAGGMTTDIGIDIGNSMINVVIGITVGLFISQTITYMFGSKKHGAVVSF